jgi:hypothetical protein
MKSFAQGAEPGKAVAKKMCNDLDLPETRVKPDQLRYDCRKIATNTDAK